MLQKLKEAVLRSAAVFENSGSENENEYVEEQEGGSGIEQEISDSGDGE